MTPFDQTQIPDIGPFLGGMSGQPDLQMLLGELRRKKTEEDWKKAAEAKMADGGSLTSKADVAPVVRAPVMAPTSAPASMPRPAAVLPQAMGAQQPAMLQPVAQDGLASRIAELEARSAELGEPADTGALQDYAAKRQEGGGRALLLALAAQHAGKSAAPIGEVMLKRALAAQTPEKFTGGQVADGKYLADPVYGRDKERAAVDSQLSRLAGQQQSDETRRWMTEENNRTRTAMNAATNATRQNIAVIDETSPTKMGAGQYKDLTKIVSDGQQAMAEIEAGEKMLKGVEGAGGGLARGLAARIPGIGTSIAQMGLDDNVKNAESILSHAMAKPVHALYGAALTGNELGAANMWRLNPADDSTEKLRKAKLFSWYTGLGVYAARKQISDNGMPPDMLDPNSKKRLVEEYVKITGKPEPLLPVQQGGNGSLGDDDFGEITVTDD